MTRIRAIIVDDEPLARERIRTLLEGEPDVDVIAECASGGEAVERVRAEKPDLVFLDIQMPELDGFGVLRELGEELPAAVIFVTAFDQFAVKAFEVHALDYLLKPFKPARFREALERARRQLAAGRGVAVSDDPTQRILALLEQQRRAEPAYITRIAVKQNDRVRFVRTEQIDWIEASGNYIVIHAGGEKHMVRETLGALEAKLSPRDFFRVSRSALVNLHSVQEAQPAFNGEHVVLLKNGARVSMTRGLRELQDKLRFL